MDGLYRLDVEGEPEPVADTLAWAEWMEQGERVVLQTQVGPHCRVSTVFLGIDYFGGALAPILWETMVFGGALNYAQRRYRSKLEALHGHLAMLALAELAAHAPRRLKKTIRKQATYQRLRPREEQRVVRAARRAEGQLQRILQELD